MAILGEYYNDFTEALDEYIQRTDKIDQDYYEFCIRTYLCLEDRPKNPVDDYHVAFRVPGATRGHIECDKNDIIKDIVFYKDTCWGKVGIYQVDKMNEMITNITKRFRDTKLDIVNGMSCDEFIDKYQKGEIPNGKISRPKENM